MPPFEWLSGPNADGFLGSLGATGLASFATYSNRALGYVNRFAPEGQQSAMCSVLSGCEKS
jgi:hypothetical protein